MKVYAHRVMRETPIRLRNTGNVAVGYGMQNHGQKMLPAGAYVQIIDPYWLPKDFDVPFSRSIEDVVYSQFGLGVIPKGSTERER